MKGTIEESWLAEEIVGIIKEQAENPPRALVNILRLCERARVPRDVKPPSGLAELRALIDSPPPELPGMADAEPNARVEGADAA